MQIIITGKQIHLGENMQQYAEKSLNSAVEKYIEDAIKAHVVFAREGDGIKAEVTVHPASGALLKGEAKANDAYVALDRAVSRIDRQLSKYKNRLKEHHNTKFEMVDMSIIENDTHEESEHGVAPVIVAEMQTELPLCSVSGAVMRMDLADLSVLMFKNTAHGGLNVVYRRADGNIGWIDPKAKG